jgi:hypothetical protein
MMVKLVDWEMKAWVQRFVLWVRIYGDSNGDFVSVLGIVLHEYVYL